MSNNYNTWGGKNNKWGNRNRKGRGNNSKRTRYTTNKLFNVIAGGIFLFMLAGFGWSILKSGFETAFQFRDNVGQVRDIIQYVTSDGTTQKCNVKLEGSIDISEDDIEGVLNYIYDSISKNNENLIILDSDDIKKESGYKKNIVNRLDKSSSSTITFAIVYDEIMNQEQAEQELERIRELITNNSEELSSTKYNSVMSGAQIYNSSDYRFIITITFATK